MPFTLSHPAAAGLFGPLVRQDRLPLAALSIGAMAPDFEYLLRLEPIAYWSHSVAGLFYFCLPVGAGALLLWELLLRRPVRRLLGVEPGETRRWGSSGLSAGWAGRAVGALLVGSATHLFWDGFTHWDAWGVEAVPALAGNAIVVVGRSIPWYSLLQHASSVLGGTVVCWWLVRQVGGSVGMRAVLGSRWRRRVIGAIAIGTLAFAAWNAFGSGDMRDPSRAKIVAGRLAVGALAGLAMSLAAYSAAYLRVDAQTGPARS